jgi:hypothetical protein
MEYKDCKHKLFEVVVDDLLISVCNTCHYFEIADGRTRTVKHTYTFKDTDTIAELIKINTELKQEISDLESRILIMRRENKSNG